MVRREMKPRPLKILVMADTHDRLPPTIATLAKGADEIWHLGDVCAPGILAAIETFGPPVTIVRGNCDSHIEWPISADLMRNGKRLRLIHIPPDEPPEDVDVVLHGHTHVPRNERVGEVTFLNPGCVTRPNQGAPASVAVLQISSAGEISWELRPLR